MNIKVVGFTQRTQLSDAGVAGTVQTYVDLGLPDGKVVQALVTEEAAAALLLACAQQRPTAKPRPEPVVEDFDVGLDDTGGLSFGGDDPVEAPARPVVVWADLPDDLLHPLMKLALEQANTPPELDGEHLQLRVKNITETYTQEDWDQLAALVAPPPAAPPPPRAKRVPARPLGQVKWREGGVQGPAAAARPLQKTDMGYPVVPGQVSVDTFVGAGDDQDEAGVGQA